MNRFLTVLGVVATIVFAEAAGANFATDRVPFGILWTVDAVVWAGLTFTFALGAQREIARRREERRKDAEVEKSLHNLEHSLNDLFGGMLEEDKKRHEHKHALGEALVDSLKEVTGLKGDIDRKLTKHEIELVEQLFYEKTKHYVVVKNEKDGISAVVSKKREATKDAKAEALRKKTVEDVIGKKRELTPVEKARRERANAARRAKRAAARAAAISSKAV